MCLVFQHTATSWDSLPALQSQAISEVVSEVITTVSQSDPATHGAGRPDSQSGEPLETGRHSVHSVQSNPESQPSSRPDSQLSVMSTGSTTSAPEAQCKVKKVRFFLCVKLLYSLYHLYY